MLLAYPVRPERRPAIAGLVHEDSPESGVYGGMSLIWFPVGPDGDEPAASLLTFVCDWSLRADDDLTILESYPANVRVIHIPCTGRIDPEMALRALRSGVDGVLVCGCAPGECHYKRGTDVSACKIGLLNLMFEQMSAVGGSAPGSPWGTGRVRFVQIGTQDRGRIRNEVDAMLEHLTAQEETV